MLKISQKGLLLVCVPLAFELVFVCTLGLLLHQTEQEIKRETKARRISSQTSIVVRGMLDFIVSIASYSVLKTTNLQSQYDDAVNNLPMELEKLVKLLASQPEKQKSAVTIGKNFRKAIEISNDARIKMESGEILAATKLLPTLKNLSLDASHRLYDLAKEERSVEAESPEIQQRLRQNLNLCLGIGILFNVLISVGLAVYFSRSITNRLLTMSTNSTRLALGQPLLPRVLGEDEIDAVDQAFHQMAKIVADTTKRERALVENAEEVICSLDPDGKFIAVNSAALSLWSYEPTELLGRRVVDILLQPDREPFLQALTKLTEGESTFPLENCIVKKDAQLRNVVWSAHWSTTDREFVCVVHDVTERKKQEDRTRFAEERSRSIIENIPTGIAICNQQGTVELINPALDKMFRLTEFGAQLINQSVSVLFNTAASEQSQMELSPQSLLDSSIKCQARRSDGTSFPVEVGCYRYQTKEGFRYLMMITDETEREQAERLKQEFIMILSHELRSPLTTLKLFLEIVSSGMYGDLSEQGLKKAASADRNITRLVKMINDLLDFETIESGNISIEPTSCPIKPVIEKAVEASRGTASSYKVSIDFESEALTVMCDEDRLIQVLINLISNAVKFSEKGSAVKVTAARRGGTLEVRVIDSGPGIPEEHKARIFERFKQVDEKESKKKGGVGLGLAICKVIVEKHGGTIGVDSEAGKGSEFWFQIPLAAEG